MHTDTRSKNDEFETEARFYHQNGLHYFYQNGFQNQRWHSTFFLNFGWLLEDLKPMSIKLL